MKKEIRQVKKDIVQVTIADERWYLKTQKDSEGMPTVKGVPSVTWVTSFYPKGIGYMKWLANNGWDEAIALRNAAGEKGSKVHKAIETILEEKELKMGTPIYNSETEKDEEMSLEEYEAVKSFVDWYNTTQEKAIKPIKTLATEETVFSNKYEFAGTVDYICEIDGQVWIIDFKTSQNVFPSHELQLSAYKAALIEQGKIKGIEKANLAILQVGYNRNKNKYKFNEVESNFKLFLSVQKIWENETKGQDIKKLEYPIKLKLN